MILAIKIRRIANTNHMITRTSAATYKIDIKEDSLPFKNRTNITTIKIVITILNILQLYQDIHFMRVINIKTETTKYETAIITSTAKECGGM